MPDAYRCMARLLHFQDSVTFATQREAGGVDEGPWCQSSMFAACTTKHRSLDDMLAIARVDPRRVNFSEDPWERFRLVDPKSKNAVVFKASDMLYPAGIHVVKAPVTRGDTFSVVDGATAKVPGRVELLRGAVNHIRLAKPAQRKRGAARSADAPASRRRDPVKALTDVKGRRSTAVSVLDAPLNCTGSHAVATWNGKTASMRRFPAAKTPASRGRRTKK